MRFTLFLSLFFVTYSAPIDDLVTNLPNVNFIPNFKHYSGYLKASETHFMHYWFIESENPKNDPIILWLSGGPGCSSVDGALVELGPFFVKDYGNTVYENVYAWNKVGSVIFLESPVGVGFSYITDGNLTTNDDLTAEDNYNALVDFFINKFPEYSSYDFYITGESYAGVYIPTLAQLIINDTTHFPNFKGMAIGNGLLNYPLLVNTVIPFFYYHNLISEIKWIEMSSKCCKGQPTNCDYYGYLKKTNYDTCYNLTVDLYSAAFNLGLDPYNMYFSCYLPPGVHPIYTPPEAHFNTLARLAALNPETLASHHAADPVPQCAHFYDNSLWINRWDVRDAFHIPVFVANWSSCSMEVSNTYDSQYPDLTNQVKNVLKAGVRVLIYNGDVDTMCNAVGDRIFVEQLGQKLIQPYQPWIYTEEMPNTAGYYIRYKGVDFVNVRGAGHFVPREKPREALQMLWNFIHKKDYSNNKTGISTKPLPSISSSSLTTINLYAFILTLLVGLM